MSFVMLTESQVAPAQETFTSATGGSKNDQSKTPVPATAPTVEHQRSLSQRIESNNRLFEILSSQSDIDHPICTECTDLLLSNFQSRLLASTKERDAYISFLKEQKNNVPSAAEVTKAENELATSKVAEEKAFAELLQLEKEKAVLEDQIADLSLESRELESDEAEFWASRNSFDLQLASFRDTKEALETSYEHDSQQLERLQRTNVYNDTFCISHDGNFGTINGLRLGRLAPPNNVEWAEINAAWGTTLLLLATVAEKLRFTFRGYVLKPMGSTSIIDRIEQTPTPSATNSSISTRPLSRAPTQPTQKITHLELYSSGDLPLVKGIIHRRFNEAMVAFLDCIKQLGDFISKSETTRQGLDQRSLPYLIEKDRIHEVSIKLGISQDEAWTSACKYTLTCCKFLLAHASNLAATGGR